MLEHDRKSKGVEWTIVFPPKAHEPKSQASAEDCMPRGGNTYQNVWSCCGGSFAISTRMKAFRALEAEVRGR